MSSTRNNENNKTVGEKAQEKAQEMSHKVRQTYRDNMPESLGGRSPTMSEIAEQGKKKLDKDTLETTKQSMEEQSRHLRREMGVDEKRKSHSSGSSGSSGSSNGQKAKAKEMYRDNAPEALGGRSPTMAEKGKEKLDSAKQRIEDETRSAKREIGADKSMTEKAKDKAQGMGDKAKEMYRDNMPESLGGRSPTMAEKGKEKLDSAKQRIKDEGRSAKHEIDTETEKSYERSSTERSSTEKDWDWDEKAKEMTEKAKEMGEKATEKAKEMGEKAKELYRDNMPEALGGRSATIAEMGKEKLDSAKQDVEDESRRFDDTDKSLTEKAKEMGEMATEKAKEMGEKAKEMYRDNMPEALGGRSPTIMPEALGGRSPTIAEKGKEKLDSAKQRIEDESQRFDTDKSMTEKAKESYRDNMPESLGGRSPTMAEKGKEKLDSAKQRFEDEARSAKRETGFDRSMTEKAKDKAQEMGEKAKGKAQEMSDKAKSKAQEMGDKAKSKSQEMGDKAKESYRDNMPESLGGRSPTMAEKGKEKLDSAKQRIKDEARSAKREIGAEKSMTEKAKDKAQEMGDKAKKMSEKMGDKAKETYRDNMPESLGGRSATMAEKGKEKLDVAKQRIEDESRSVKDQATKAKAKAQAKAKATKAKVEAETEAETGSDKSLIDQGKEVYRENMPEALGGRSPTMAEKGKAKFDKMKKRTDDELRSAKYEGEKKLESAKERTDDEIRSAKEGGKSLLKRGKEMYKENAPESLGGRPQQYQEQYQEQYQQQQQHKSLFQKGKEILTGFLGFSSSTTTTNNPVVNKERDTSAMDTTDNAQYHRRDSIRSKDSSRDLPIDNRPEPMTTTTTRTTTKEQEIGLPRVLSFQQAELVYRENDLFS